MTYELTRKESESIDFFLKEYLDIYNDENVYKGKIIFLIKKAGITDNRIDFVLKELSSLNILSIKNKRGVKILGIKLNKKEIIGFLKNGGMTDKWLEREQKRIDISLSEKTLKEFPKTKWIARIGFIIGVVLVIKELYLLLWGE